MLLAAMATPPEAAINQSAVWPGPTVTFSEGLAGFSQTFRLPLLTGAETVGQLQTGAFTLFVCKQFPRVAVRVTSVPAGTFITWLPLILPAEVVTVPLLVKLMV